MSLQSNEFNPYKQMYTFLSKTCSLEDNFRGHFLRTWPPEEEFLINGTRQATVMSGEVQTKNMVCTKYSFYAKQISKKT